MATLAALDGDFAGAGDQQRFPLSEPFGSVSDLIERLCL